MNSSNALAPSILCNQRSERRRTMTQDTSAYRDDGFHQGMKDVSLAANRLLALPPAALTVLCLEGELWLTRDGDYEDHILGAGQRFMVGRRDQATVQALRPSRVRIISANV